MSGELSPIDKAKFVSAKRAAQYVEDGMRVGLGTGSTAAWLVRCLGELVRDDGLKIKGVPTSSRTAQLARDVWIAVISLCSTIGPFVLILHWQRFVSITEAGMIYGLTPVFTMFNGLFLPGLLMQLTGIPYENEILTTVFLIGAALVVAANVVMQFFHVAAPHIETVPLPESPDAE